VLLTLLVAKIFETITSNFKVSSIDVPTAASHKYVAFYKKPLVRMPVGGCTCTRRENKCFLNSSQKATTVEGNRIA
jgi:hypothetical protein